DRSPSPSNRNVEPALVPSQATSNESTPSITTWNRLSMDELHWPLPAKVTSPSDSSIVTALPSVTAYDARSSTSKVARSCHTIVSLRLSMSLTVNTAFTVTGVVVPDSTNVY